MIPTKRAVVAFVLIVCCCATSFAQKVGDKVFTSEEAELKSGTAVVGKVGLGVLLDVERVNGEWLWVNYIGTKGWINKKEVVLPDQAIEELTKKIKSNPTAESYRIRAFAWIHKGELDPALADLTEAIRLDPNSAAFYNSRGNLWKRKRDYDKAVSDLTEAIRLESMTRNLAMAYDNRGSVWLMKQEYHKAIADCTEAIRLDPKFVKPYHRRGTAWESTQEYDKAIADFAEVIRLDPNHAIAYGKRAWLYATCPDARYRNGEQAVKDATKAGELVDWKIPVALETLAAAYAESGDFTNAVKWQEKAVEMSTAADNSQLEQRLTLYKSGKPYREGRKK